MKAQKEGDPLFHKFNHTIGNIEQSSPKSSVSKKPVPDSDKNLPSAGSLDKSITKSCALVSNTENLGIL